MKFRAILSLILLSGIIGFGFISCKKDKTCKVLIFVQDSLEEPVLGALVFLDCDPSENADNGPCIIQDSARTKTDGTARFEFANPGILKLFVNGNPEGYVELEAGETVEKIVEL